MECVRLRVKDVDFARGEITVRDGKGGKDRVTMVPRALGRPLRAQLARVRRRLAGRPRWQAAREWTLPDALARKYPKAGESWALVVGVPVRRSASRDPRSGVRRRHHCTKNAPAGGQRAHPRRRHRQAGDAAHAAALRSPRTCSRPATTSAPCRSCSGTRT